MRSTDHPQDDLLIVEALHQHGHELKDEDSIRANRAFELARNIAAEHGLDVSDALFQLQRANETGEKLVTRETSPWHNK